jgi:hypothetical protein
MRRSHAFGDPFVYPLIVKTLLEALRNQRPCACACHALLSAEDRTRGVEALYACDDAMHGFGYEPDYELHGDALFRAAQKKNDPADLHVAVRFGECMYKRLVGSLLHELLHATFGEPGKANYGMPWALPYGVPEDVPPRDEEAYLGRFNQSEAKAFVGVWVIGKAMFGIEWSLRTARDVGTYGFASGNAMVPVPKGFRPVAHLDRKHHSERYYTRARKLEDEARAYFADASHVDAVVRTIRSVARKEKRPPAGDFGRMAPKKIFGKDPCICGSQLPYAECCARLGPTSGLPVASIAR